MTRRLRDASELILPDVVAAVAELERSGRLRPEDAAAAKLAKRYARLIDTAAELAFGLEDLATEHPDHEAMVEALLAKIHGSLTLDRLGPKLLAALDAIGATPKSRGVGRGVSGGAKPGGKLQGLRDSRAG